MKSRDEIEERITRLTRHAEFFASEIALLGSDEEIFKLDKAERNNKLITKELMRIEEEGFRSQVYALRWVLREGEV